MGCMPLERTTNVANDDECVESYNIVAASFNDKLKGLVGKLNSQLPGASFVLSNPYFAFLQIIRNPSLYGKFRFFLDSIRYSSTCDLCERFLFFPTHKKESF